LSKQHYTYCLVLVISRNGFELDFTIELKIDLNVKQAPLLNIVKTKCKHVSSLFL